MLPLAWPVAIYPNKVRTEGVLPVAVVYPPGRFLLVLPGMAATTTISSTP